MHAGMLGSGVDENTCGMVEDGRIITICGKNAITIVDGKETVATNVEEVTGSHPVAVSGLRIHVLTEECSFNMKTRHAVVPGIRLELRKGY